MEGSMHIRKKTIDEEFKDFWVPIIFDAKNGRLNLEQLKKELYDYSMLLENVPKVYCEVSGGKISKPNTDPEEVILAFNDLLNETVDDAIKEHDQITTG
jgi:hypothetical protein